MKPSELVRKYWSVPNVDMVGCFKDLDKNFISIKEHINIKERIEIHHNACRRELEKENQEYKEANKHLKECWKERTAEWKEIEDKLKQQLTDLKKIAKERTQDMCKESELKFKSVYKLVEENKALKIIAMNLDNQISEYKKANKHLKKCWKERTAEWKEIEDKLKKQLKEKDKLLRTKIG